MEPEKISTRVYFPLRDCQGLNLQCQLPGLFPPPILALLSLSPSGLPLFAFHPCCLWPVLPSYPLPPLSSCLYPPPPPPFGGELFCPLAGPGVLLIMVLGFSVSGLWGGGGCLSGPGAQQSINHSHLFINSACISCKESSEQATLVVDLGTHQQPNEMPWLKLEGFPASEFS